MKFQCCSLFTVLMLSLSPLSATREDGEDGGRVPFELHRDYMIVVKATAGESVRLKVQIDTGANYSVLDQSIVRKLGLKSVGRKYKVSAFGKTKMVGRVVLSQLRIGPLFSSLPCLVDDLSWLGLDAIIGLDLLRRTPFTIDFESGFLSFGNLDNLGSQLPFEDHSSLVVVLVQVQGQQLRLAVDTGARRINLFRDQVRDWKKSMRVLGRRSVAQVGGKSRVTEVALTDLRLGQSDWKSHDAFVLETASDNGVDGVIGLASLNLKRVHFDFANRLLSWER